MQYIHTLYVLSIPNGLSPKNHKGVEAFLQLFSNSKDNLLPPIIKESSPIWAARICRPTLWNILNQKFQAKMQERRGWLMDSSDWSQRWHLSGWGIPFLAGRSAVQHLQWGGLAVCSYRHSYLVPFFEWPIGISYRGCTPSSLIIGLRRKKNVPSAESSRSVRGLGKGVSGKPYPCLCNARRPWLKPGTFRSQAVRLYRLHQARPSYHRIETILLLF